ncbi:MAG: hypothetical protein D6723_13675 [Acidobacteria bacterium]|nr:MAG: hypothetical protein D6723_13675 [Acidobacteriota bacterium]
MGEEIRTPPPPGVLIHALFDITFNAPHALGSMLSNITAEAQRFSTRPFSFPDVARARFGRLPGR